MRLIDADKIIFREIDEIGGEYEPYLGCAKSQIDNLPTVEAVPVTEKAFEMFEADYEARLKADMVAVLEEMKKEMNPIKECEHQIYGKEHWNFAGKCQDVIQQKINELKAESEG
ncbi:MAG: hypothetical protein IIZ78_07155 [Clostridiales bacterium]|nr:hypothetical protein [Clostridiales bacterium]